jgi:hypothetical protein
MMHPRDHAVGEQPRVVFAQPFADLESELREDARRLRELGGDGAATAFLSAAERLRVAVSAAAVGGWVLTEDAAPLLKITPDAVRARCRRDLRWRGLAKREGGRWFVHVTALGRAA